MSAEDQEMMARISQLAGMYHVSPMYYFPSVLTDVSASGQINRRKNQQAGQAPTPSYNQSPYLRTYPSHHVSHRITIDIPEETRPPSTTWNRGGGSYRARGYRGGKTPVHRNRTLVLNGAGQSSKNGETEAGGESTEAANASWVSKSDRHLQLINTSIYEKEAQARTKAIEQTRKQKLARKNELERAKLVKHLHRMADNSGNNVSQGPSNKYEISVQGINFLVAKNGSKLVKSPGTSRRARIQLHHVSLTSYAGDNNSAKATPKMAIIGGVKFYRSKNGNLYRHGIVKAQRYVSQPVDGRFLTKAVARRSGVIKKVNVPCRMFSTTGISLLPETKSNYSELWL
jgi:hypothetical protein